MKKRLTLKECEKVYNEKGAGAVYDLANKFKLPYSNCNPCEAETPTINKCCAVCGSSKN